MSGKIVVDATLMDGHDLIAIEEATGKSLGAVMGSAAGIYAVAWRARLHAGDVDATYDNTLDMPLSSFDMTTAESAEALGGGNGAGPLPSLVSGT